MVRKTLLSACMVATLTWGLPATASAQNDSPYKDTYFTFSQAVSLPNMNLPAGKYLFRAADRDRMIVQVYTGDRAKMLGTVMSVQAVRSSAPEKAEIRLIESSAASPVAIGSWWYPGQRQGWEFIYPRAQAMTLAKNAKQPILTTAKNTSPEETKSSDLVRLSPSGEETPYSPNSSEPARVSGAAQVGEVAAADQNANRVAAAMTQDRPATQSARAETTRQNLPQTASSTPLVALVGVLALALAFGLRLWHRPVA
jgi:hypothetical protein